MAAKAQVRSGSGWRPLRWLLALLLAPIALGGSWAVVDVIRLTGRVVDVWVPMAAGGAIWLVVFLSLPKPMWLYVVGHELTHALWALFFGGRIKAFKATRHGGHVVLTKSNALIVLAPYFFPLYAALWTAGYLTLAWFLGWGGPGFWFHLGLGVAYMFHVTLTASILRTRQPDLESEGWLFSTVMIWLVHVLILLLVLPWLSGRVAPVTAFLWAGDRTLRIIAQLARWMGWAG